MLVVYFWDRLVNRLQIAMNVMLFGEQSGDQRKGGRNIRWIFFSKKYQKIESILKEGVCV